jgi:hypothetical protein
MGSPALNLLLASTLVDMGEVSVVPVCHAISFLGFGEH